MENNVEWIDIKQKRVECSLCGDIVDDGILYIRIDRINEDYSWQDDDGHYLCNECNNIENAKIGKDNILTFNSVEDLKKYLMVERL